MGNSLFVVVYLFDLYQVSLFLRAQLAAKRCDQMLICSFAAAPHSARGDSMQMLPQVFLNVA